MSARGRGIPRYLRPMPKRVLGLPKIVWTIVVLIVLLGIVEGVAHSPAVTRFELVPIETMVRQAISLLGNGSFLKDALLHSSLMILVSFALASVVGILIALVMHAFGVVRRALNPFLSVYYSVPTFALYPIVVVIFGTGAVPIVITASAFAVISVTVKGLEGFDSVPVVIDKLGRSLELTGMKRVRTILLPAALPDVAAGLKLAFGYSIIAVLATEFILATQGLGWYISNEYDEFQIAGMYGAILIVAALALLANAGLGAVLRRFDWRRW
jgi:NitT/TauT family transport system permease protein